MFESYNWGLRGLFDRRLYERLSKSGGHPKNIDRLCPKFVSQSARKLPHSAGMSKRIFIFFHRGQTVDPERLLAGKKAHESRGGDRADPTNARPGGRACPKWQRIRPAPEFPTTRFSPDRGLKQSPMGSANGDPPNRQLETFFSPEGLRSREAKNRPCPGPKDGVY